MLKSAKHLLIGSTDAHSGKSTMGIAIGFQLKALGFEVGWGKPLASVETVGDGTEGVDIDVGFVPDMLSLPPEQQLPTLFALDQHTFADQLRQGSPDGFANGLERYWENATGDIMLLEGPPTLEEGALLSLSLPEIATALKASVLLVMQFNTHSMVDQLIAAQERLSGALLGVILNEIDEADEAFAMDAIVPYLEGRGIPVLATLPRLPFLRCMRVSELVKHLDAEVLCCQDHLNLTVESLKIGAMTVNAAMRFFGQGIHQAVVTGGDRRDLQIAALETSTHCLILTGQIAPSRDVIMLAQDKEVPILAVATDTLTTVERIDTLFGRTPLANPDKVTIIKEVLAPEMDIKRLIALMGLDMPAIAPHS